MLKLEDNPPVLFPPEASLESIAGPWWVAHTRSRNEKSLAWFLQQWNIAYFLPLREKISHRKGRKYKTLLPLFSGYVFFSGTEQDRYRALTSNRIAQVIPVVDQAGLRSELLRIYRALQSGLPIDPHPYLKQGKRCRVKSGALMGLEGIVVRKKNHVRILLQVEILGQAAAVEIDADLLEPLD